MLKRRDSVCCPMCGQRVLIRHGVQLPPLLADLFDMIERSGKDGIYGDVLCGVFYPGKPLRDARNCIKSNVWHLNERFASTDIEIRAGSGGDHSYSKPFRVIKRRHP